MAGFFSKFFRGAASTGAKLYADQAAQEMQANLMTKREQTLQQNRQVLQDQAQKVQAVEAEKAREFRSAEAEKVRVARASEVETARLTREESSAGKLDALKLEEAQKMQNLTIQYDAAETKEEKLDVVKNIMARSGRPMESLVTGTKLTVNQKDIKAMVDAGVYPDLKTAWKAWKADSKNLAGAVFKSLRSEQENLMFDGEPKTVAESVAEMRRILKAETPDVVPPPPVSAPEPTPTPTLTPTSGAKDFISASDITPADRVIVNDSTQERMVFRDGRWLPVR